MKPVVILSLAGCFLAGPLVEAASTPRPNVLFIAVDDLRPEIGAYGNKIVKTPNLDRLAARGMVFDHAYCQQAVCSPSRSSLLTGRRPDATKVWDLETHFRVALPEAVTLPQHFRENGYYCAALSKVYHVGFEDGPSWSEPHWYPNGTTVEVDPHDWSKRTVLQVGPGAKSSGRGANPADNDEHAGKQEPKRPGKAGKAPKANAFEQSASTDDELPDGFTAAEAVRRLHTLKEKKEPFFLAVGFLKPHLPFIAPKKYWDLYDPEKIPVPAIDHLPEGAPAFAGHTNGELHGYANIPAGNPIPEALAKTLRHGYYACISYTDAQVGRLLDALDQEGLAENTVVVLWGDHGWQLGDHGLWHKHTNFELATRAPLLLSVPGQKRAGQHCAAPVEFIDIYPTLADVCGLPKPSGVDGVSLRPLLEDPQKSLLRAAISQYPRKDPDAGSLMGYSGRDARWRLTLWKSTESGETVATELYDEQNDPAETVNVATNPENVKVVAELTQFIEGIAKPIGAVKGKGGGKPSKKPTSQKEEQPAPAASASPGAAIAGAHDREAMFRKRDANRDGRLTMEEFLQFQTDEKEARARFSGFDKDKDGVLSKEEFINSKGR